MPNGRDSLMPTQCNRPDLVFQPLGQRAVVGRFDGGTISSDGGCLLLGEAERLTGTLRQLTACFTDHRDPEAIEHTVGELVAQRGYGLALGYEDLNDHYALRLARLLATLVGKGDPTGSGLPGAASGGSALRSTSRRAAWRNGSLSAPSARRVSTTSAGSFFCRHNCSTSRSASGRRAAASRRAWRLRVHAMRMLGNLGKPRRIVAPAD